MIGGPALPEAMARLIFISSVGQDASATRILERFAPSHLAPFQALPMLGFAPVRWACRWAIRAAVPLLAGLRLQVEVDDGAEPNGPPGLGLPNQESLGCDHYPEPPERPPLRRSESLRRPAATAVGASAHDGRECDPHGRHTRSIRRS
jgi:hypothetical protein